MNPYGVLAGTIGVIVVGYLVFHKVRADYSQFGELSGFAVFLEFLIFFLHGSSSYLFLDSNLQTVQWDSFTFWLGVACMILGLAGTIAGMVQLTWMKSLGKDTGSLRVVGLYRFTRNPQIVFYGLFVLGYALFWPSWSGAVWVTTYAVIAHIMVLTEEEHLREVFGEAYDHYCLRTARYFGLPSKSQSDSWVKHNHA